MHYVVAIEAIRKHMISTQNSCHVDVAGMLANTARKSLEQAGLTMPLLNPIKDKVTSFFSTQNPPLGRCRADTEHFTGVGGLRSKCT